MSRVGKKPIPLPTSVKVEVGGDLITVTGPKGSLKHRIPGGVKVSVKDGNLAVERLSSAKEESSLQGLTRAIIANLVKGVVDGYKKELEIKGVGFKAQAEGPLLRITLGFSHPIRYSVPDGVTVATPKPTQIIVSGIDKVKVGEVSAEIRDFFKPEPYTGKGIRYVGEYVRHKAGKTVTK